MLPDMSCPAGFDAICKTELRLTLEFKGVLRMVQMHRILDSYFQCNGQPYLLALCAAPLNSLPYNDWYQGTVAHHALKAQNALFATITFH